jgi:hypothetical protein
MVLDPPAFAYLDDGAYVVAPSDGLSAAREVTRHYGACYWALDALPAPDQEALYRRHARLPWLRWVSSVDGVQIYEVANRLLKVLLSPPSGAPILPPEHSTRVW